MTHIRNVESFTRVVEFCTGFGGAYNPGHVNLQLDTLHHQVSEVRAVMHQVMVAKAALDAITNERTQVYDQLPKLTARVLRYLEASRASKELMADVRRYFRELVGKTPRPAVESHAIRQLAFASKVNTFSNLVHAIQTEPGFRPNEPVLQLASLERHIITLQELNTSVDLARLAWRQAIIKRNNLMYRDYYSLANTLWAVKKYLRAVFGWGSAEYNLIRKYEIVKPAFRT